MALHFQIQHLSQAYGERNEDPHLRLPVWKSSYNFHTGFVLIAVSAPTP